MLIQSNIYKLLRAWRWDGTFCDCLSVCLVHYRYY